MRLITVRVRAPFRFTSPLLLTALLFTSALLWGCGGKEVDTDARGGKRGGMRFPVEVAEVKQVPVTATLHAVGSVDAYETVQVTARVAGTADKVRFQEGTSVSAGTVLVEIDADRYRLALNAAEATQRKADAALADAQAGLGRREAVSAKTPGLIPGEEIETWKTKVAAAAADLAQATAARDQAALNLRDALVRAPSSGLMQSRSISTGQYVQAGTLLGTLVRRDPLQLRCTVPDRDAGILKPGLVARFTVTGDTTVHSARITFVADAADPGTRMVQVVGTVLPPSTRTLRPGTFAEVTFTVGQPRPAPVIPQTAIRPSEKGFLAYVVEQGVARERILTLGMRTPEGAVVVLSGLKPGESLVIRGAEALREGAKVVLPGQSPKGASAR